MTTKNGIEYKAAITECLYGLQALRYNVTALLACEPGGSFSKETP